MYRELVDAGFMPGYAADDSAAFHFEGTTLRQVVTSQPEARGYRVEHGAETPLPARLLS